MDPERPQTPLMCPRCSSMNTKFRYYNNHSLSQPRHYCRDCKRQWTVGGSLRAIPVGGTTRIKQTDAQGSKCGGSRSQSQPLQLPSGVPMPHFQEPTAPLNSFHFGNEFPKLDAMDSFIQPRVGFGSFGMNPMHDWNVESLAPTQAFPQQVPGSYNLHIDFVQPTWSMDFANQEAINNSGFSTNLDLPSSSVNTTQWPEFPGYGPSYK